MTTRRHRSGTLKPTPREVANRRSKQVKWVPERKTDKLETLIPDLVGRILAFLPLDQLLETERLSTKSRDKYFRKAIAATESVKFDMCSSERQQGRVCKLLARHNRRNLRRLDLHHYGPPTAVELILKHCNGLRWVGYLDASLLARNSIPPQPSLKTLLVNMVDSRNGLSIATKCPNLECLHLECNLLYIHTARATLAPIWRSCAGLRKLGLVLFTLQPSDYRDLAENLRELRKLSFSSADMTNEDCSILSRYLSPIVVELKLSGFAVTEEGIRHLAFALPNLTNLDITFTGLSQQGLMRLLHPNDPEISTRESMPRYATQAYFDESASFQSTGDVKTTRQFPRNYFPALKSLCTSYFGTMRNSFIVPTVQTMDAREILVNGVDCDLYQLNSITMD